MPVDLDAASGEALHPAARATLLAALDQGYADPRRLHGPARTARLLLDNAREVVAECLGARPDEVTFTGSGTEAVQRGLLGLATGEGRTVAHSAVEHSSVLHALDWSARRGGARGVEIPVDREGHVEVAALTEAVGAGGDTMAAVALQSANHEVGTLQPVSAVVEAIGPGIPLFVDACASAGRQALPQGWSVAAASAHKWGGPAGIGVLLVRKGSPWRNPFPADDRVDERTAGFENVPAALAAAAALQAVTADESTGRRQHAMVDAIRSAVAAIPDVEVVGDPVDRLPHLVTFSCLYLDGEAIVTELDRLGYGVASGSACSSSSLRPSHVLAAMGVLTHGNIRVSLPRDVTDEDVDGFLAVLPGAVADIRARIGL